MWKIEIIINKIIGYIRLSILYNLERSFFYYSCDFAKLIWNWKIPKILYTKIKNKNVNSKEIIWIQDNWLSCSNNLFSRFKTSWRRRFYIFDRQSPCLRLAIYIYDPMMKKNVWQRLVLLLLKIFSININILVHES